MNFRDIIPFKGRNAQAIVSIPPKYLPCECKNGKSTEHQYNRDSFNCRVFVCCECGREKRVVE